MPDTRTTRRPPRIAHILPWPAIGGIEVATLRIAEAVRPHGFESVAFCPGADSAVARLFASAGFETVSYERVEPSYRRPVPYLRNSLRLARELRRRRVDLVHCSDILGAYYAGLAGRLARLPVLSQIRNRYEEISRRDQSFLRPVQHFAFVSRDTWSRFAFPVPEHRGSVVYDGLELDLEDGTAQAQDRDDVCREFGIPADAAIVGMVARIAPQKDYHTLVRAARRVVAECPHARFLLVGDHSSAETYRAHHVEVRQAIEEAGLGEHFVFTDFRRDVPRFMRALDLFVLSTHLEGLPLVILEAMARGKAVVATAVDGVPEVVVEGETGLLHGHQDDEALAACILALLHDPARRARMGAAGRALVRERFSAEQFAASLVELYDRLLRAPRPSGGRAEAEIRRGEWVTG